MVASLLEHQYRAAARRELIRAGSPAGSGADHDDFAFHLEVALRWAIGWSGPRSGLAGIGERPVGDPFEVAWAFGDGRQPGDGSLAADVRLHLGVVEMGSLEWRKDGPQNRPRPRRAPL